MNLVYFNLNQGLIPRRLRRETLFVIPVPCPQCFRIRDAGGKTGIQTGSPIPPEAGRRVGDDKVIFQKAYTVGPEIMEMKVAQTCWDNNISFEVSLERFMKCCFGICGQCCVDPTGWRMCVEGPVIDGAKLKQITEFGKYHRTASGKVEKFPWVKKV